MERLNLQGAKELIKSGTGVVTFGATWCKDCKIAQPLLMELAGEYTSVKFYGVDVDEDEATRDEFGIRHIPTIVFIKDGEEVCQRVVEPKSKEQIEECVKKLI